MKHSILGTACAGLLLAASGTANAALVSRLGGLAYYDDVANVTWLADANYAKTSGASATGQMDWSTANAWAGSLTIDGVTGWQLPNTVQPDPSCDSQGAGISFGFNCTGSPMGELFYNELGGQAFQPISSTHNSNYNLFSNIQSDFYWSATEFAFNTSAAWAFGFKDGQQYEYDKTDTWYTWAVHAGDVAPVPLPAAVWLFGTGLLGLMGITRRKAA